MGKRQGKYFLIWTPSRGGNNTPAGGFMWYVYCRYVKSGREDCVNRTFDTVEDAIKHIALCYATDKDLHQLGEYYYFMKHH